jgi:hypothetical protein
VIRLLKRRTLWVPTIWGWLVLLLVGAGALLAAALGLHPFLATSEPVHARLLVVEGWLAPAALEQALETFREGKYERIATTGGPIDSAFEFFFPADGNEMGRRANAYKGERRRAQGRPERGR